MNNFLTRRLLRWLGNTALKLRAWESAINHLEALYLMLKAHKGAHNLATAETATKLSYALLRTKKNEDFEYARRLMYETNETTSRLLPADDFRQAEVNALLGEIALRQRQFNSALILLQLAIDVFDNAPRMSVWGLIEVLELLEQTCHQAGWNEQEASVRNRINTIENADRLARESESYDRLDKFRL